MLTYNNPGFEPQWNHVLNGGSCGVLCVLLVHTDFVYK